MASLPTTPFTLKGGCFCSAIRYTVSVPELSARPVIPEPPETQIGPATEVTKRMPLIDLDHCTSCRRITSSLVQTWLLVPQKWVQFSLQPIPSSSTADVGKTDDALTPATLDVISGKSWLGETTYAKHFSSSEGVNRIFCGRCGTHLTFHYAKATGMAARAKELGMDWDPHMDLTLGSLDREDLEREGMRVTEGAHLADGISWVKRWLKDGEKVFSE